MFSRAKKKDFCRKMSDEKHPSKSPNINQQGVGNSYLHYKKFYKQSSSSNTKKSSNFKLDRPVKTENEKQIEK